MPLEIFSLPITFLVVLIFVQTMIPSIARWNFSKFEDGSKPTLKDGMGPRDVMPPTSKFAGRAQRAMNNMIEAMTMFTPALALALISGPSELTVTGVWLFVAGRTIYVPSYLFGILYVRSACWTAGLVGIGLLLYSAF